MSASCISEPRLSLELVPVTAFCSNLRSLIPEQWETLRRDTYFNAGYRCEICGGRGPEHPVEAHERWDYRGELDRTTGWILPFQYLTGIWALCPACHEAKHLGLAEKRGRLPQVLAHIAKVNDWTLPQAKRYAAHAFRIWEERSQHLWGLDINWLRDYVKDLPQYRWEPQEREIQWNLIEKYTGES